MKKLMIYVAVLAATTMAACSGNVESQATANEEASLKAKIENCSSPDSMAIYVNDIKAYAQKLVDEGKVAEAREFLNQITPAVQEKAPALAPTLEATKQEYSRLPGAAVDSLKEAAGNAVDTIGAKAGHVKDAVVDKTKEITTDIKDGTVNTYNKVKNGAQDAATSAAEGAANAINHAIGK